MVLRCTLDNTTDREFGWVKKMIPRERKKGLKERSGNHKLLFQKLMAAFKQALYTLQATTTGKLYLYCT